MSRPELVAMGLAGGTAFGFASYFLGLGLCNAYVWLRRRWYRWQGHREFTQADRVSLNALARMERKP